MSSKQSVDSGAVMEVPAILRVSGASGPRAHVSGGLDVWEYVLVARDFGNDAGAVATHLGEPLARVEAALRYYADHPEQINGRLDEIDAAASRMFGSKS